MTKTQQQGKTQTKMKQMKQHTATKNKTFYFFFLKWDHLKVFEKTLPEKTNKFKIFLNLFTNIVVYLETNFDFTSSNYLLL